MDVRGALDLDVSYRNLFTEIRMHFTVRGDASPEQLQELVARAQQPCSTWSPTASRGR